MSAEITLPLDPEHFRGVSMDAQTGRISGEMRCSCHEWFPFDVGLTDHVRDFAPGEHGTCRVPAWLGDLRGALR